MNPQQLTIRRPDDWHLHVRDGVLLSAVLSASARQFARAIIMPNLLPPITTTSAALAYRKRILQALTPLPGRHFEPLMTLYLTEDLSPDEISRAHECGVIHAVKLYPAGATTHSASGVANITEVFLILERMQHLGMPLLIHGEAIGEEIDIFDREALFIERTLIPLRDRFPELKIVFEHITTQTAVDYVRSCETGIAATITAHHLLENRNALFAGGIRPHLYCLPILKRERDRQALLEAATSEDRRFFLGTDSAPHLRTDKETACGCAGLFTALSAMEFYAQAFASVGALERLEGFASLNGPAFYGLPPNEERLTIVCDDWQVPEAVPVPGADGMEIVPFCAGETLHWKVLDQAYHETE